VSGKGTIDRRGLTKADLIDTVYDRHGALTKAEAAEIVDSIFQAVKSTLAGGRAVRITNFGTFQVVERPSRRGVNPVSGQGIEIPAKRGLSFRPARHLRQVVAPPDPSTGTSPQKRRPTRRPAGPIARSTSRNDR
jgi:integration host factor subunit alpha